MHNEAISAAVADQALRHVDVCWALHFEAIAVSNSLYLDVVGLYMDSGAARPPHRH